MKPQTKPLRMIALAALWLAITKLGLDDGAWLLPTSVARRMTLDEFLPLAQTVTFAIGLALAWLLLREPWAALGVRRASGRALGFAVLAAPGLWVTALATGIAVALPTLLEEIRRGGAAVSQQNTGAFGRAIEGAPVALTIAWTVMVAPITEELLFRGALWSAIQGVVGAPAATAASAAPPSSAPSSGLPAALLDDGPVVRALRWAWAALRGGGIATIGAALVFAAMHLGMPGGEGIVRVVSALWLGLACGVARQAAGSLAAPLALHVVYNLISIGDARKWLVSDAFPKRYGIPTLVAVAAAAAIVAMGVLAIVGRARRPVNRELDLE